MEALIWIGGYIGVCFCLVWVLDRLPTGDEELDRIRAIERLGIREQRSWKEWFQSDFWQWLQIIGFFLFIAFVVVNSEDRPLSLSEYVEMATREMAESAQRCRDGQVIYCDLVRRQAEAMLHGSGAERCVYGDGNYESCRDAAYELLEKQAEDY